MSQIGLEFSGVSACNSLPRKFFLIWLELSPCELQQETVVPQSRSKLWREPSPPSLESMGSSPRALGFCLKAILLDQPGWIQLPLAEGYGHPHRFAPLPSGRGIRVTRIQTGLGNFALGKSPRRSGLAELENQIPSGPGSLQRPQHAHARRHTYTHAHTDSFPHLQPRSPPHPVTRLLALS